MAELNRTFVLGRMNKSYDQRVVPNGEYIDALNVRMGSTEKSEVGVIENAKGNVALSNLRYIEGTPLSDQAKCIGAYADGANETVYWFVHDPACTVSPIGKLDLIVSLNDLTGILTYHIISVWDGTSSDTTLNFDLENLITGVNKIGDLLFFTNGAQNPPRFINVKKGYLPPLFDIDQFSAEELLVIKKPPVSAPAVEPVNIGGQSNYLDTRFISFAYRYRYANNMYSATSQWSDIAFNPAEFGFTDDSFLNIGMINSCNAAVITYNSGGPLVLGIDLLFKQADSNVVNVIEKIDKQVSGLIDFTDYSFTFSNSKIFTILPEAELLRLYDNVPLNAFAQTLMGNRLMYGNYIEGYDMIDSLDMPVLLEYQASLVTNPIMNKPIVTALADGAYTINGYHAVTNCILNLEMDGVPLKKNTSISFDVTLGHDSFTGSVPGPEVNSSISVNFSVVLKNDYSSVYAFATSAEFQEAIGTVSNIQIVPDACNGTRMTDIQNCNADGTLNGYTKFGSGQSAVGQPISIITATTSSLIGLKFVAMQYVNDINTPTDSFYEYYRVTYASVSYSDISNPRSLHSNRDYEIGIVYMDEFGRSTTALVSPFNTVHVPCGNSDVQNKIYVTIPFTQRPPAWAKRYKFVCKPDEAGYDTIYATTYFLDPGTNDCYLLLEGENTKKVEVGDKLIVKADANGPKASCVEVTVLEKQDKASEFITPSTGAVVPGGVYMKINTNNISVRQDINGIIPFDKKTSYASAGSCPYLSYPMNLEDPANPGSYIDYDVPIGSRITMKFSVHRAGGASPIGERTYTFEKTFISSSSYPNMEAWFNGDSIALSLNDGLLETMGTQCPCNNIFLPGNNPPGIIGPCQDCDNYLGFYRDGGTNQLVLNFQGFQNNVPFIPGSLEVDFQVIRSNGVLIFETEPVDALPDVFYENNLSFPISGGNHLCNVQNQDIGVSQNGIVDTGFFNCFAFGNGAESYKISDSIVGHTFNLGERVTSTSAQDYGRVIRFADMTYSGVFNPESNVDRLNEFNLGLSNYKKLESSFGPIRVLDGRETDVLVLQEDKISYVLAGKNLLSDSAAGGAISSVPEVLGTQIARVEKYGVSFNPESYVHWGANRYFTDVKRGAVLQLTGDSYQNENLFVISDAGMRTWFRDNFIESFGTQKLGGYDPYMDEYVLSSNDTALPYNQSCIDCSVTQSFFIPGPPNEETVTSYCANVGNLVGVLYVSYSVASLSDGAHIEIIADYNGDTVSSGIIDTIATGSFPVSKDKNYIDTTSIQIVSVGSVAIDVKVGCIDTVQSMKLTQVVLTPNALAGESIHTQYRYFDGSFVGPLQSNAVVFASGTGQNVTSLWSSITGPLGAGAIPMVGSTVRMQANKIGPDSFDFSALNNSFKYLVSPVEYTNTDADIAAMLAAASTATPNMGSSPLFYADFEMPALTGYFVYLIWDLRKSIATDLCYGASASEVCCGCAPCEECSLIRIDNTANDAACTAQFNNGVCGDTPGSVWLQDVPAFSYFEICINPDNIIEIVSGPDPIIETLQCGCTYCPNGNCNQWIFSANDSLGVGAIFNYIACDGTPVLGYHIVSPNSVILCVKQNTTPQLVAGQGDVALFRRCVNPIDC
jgi:hypothetical protein